MSGDKNFDAVAGSTVYDSAGDKVGKVEQLYISSDSGEPRWVSVKTGLFGSSKSLVPLAGAKHSDDRLDVAVTKDVIKDAPHLDSDEGTSNAQEAALLQHYGLKQETAGWNQYGKHTQDHSNDSAAGSGQNAAATGQAAAAASGQAAGSGHNAAASGQAAASGHNAAATGRNAAASDAETADSLIRSEERINVSTQREETGRARLRKYVVTEEQSVKVPVSHEEVHVVREPITGADAANARIGEEEAEVTLHGDRVIANKEAVAVERVGLAVEEHQGEEVVSDTVRKERIETEGIDTPKDTKK